MNHSLSRFLLLFFVTLTLSSSLYGQAGKISFSQLWKTDVKTFLENSPVLIDMEGTGESQVIVAGREDLVALDSKGKEIWKYRSSGRYMMSPSILNVTGKSPLIFATDNSGNLRCHDIKGKVIWETKLSAGCTWSAPALADLMEEGIPMVVQADESGTVYAFHAQTGKPVWKSSIIGKPSAAAIGDLDGQPGLEIAYFSTEGVLSVLHADGSSFWNRKVGGTSQTWGTASPVIFVASDGCSRVFAASGDGEAYCFSASGDLLWNKNVQSPVASTLSAGDIDQDGIVDLFLITQLGVIYRFSENAGILWNIDMQGRTLGSGSIADLDGDGELEYIFCTQDGHLQALNTGGSPVFDYNFGHRAINETPTFGEVSKNTAGSEMVITGGETGLVYCFRTSAPVNGKKQWATYGGSDTKQNYWNGLTSKSQLSMTPDHLQWNELYLGEDLCFHVYNPENTGNLISIEVSCTHPDGKYQSVTSKLAGHTSQICLPFTGTTPGKYQFNWKLTDNKDKVMLNGSRTMEIVPFLNEQSIAATGVQRLKATSEKISQVNSDLSNTLQQESDFILQQINRLKPEQQSYLAGGVPATGNILSKSNQLTRKAKKAIKIADLAEAAVAISANITLLPSEGKLWENREREEELPSTASGNIKIFRTMVAGENEPVSINLFNLAGRTVTARISTDSIPDGILAETGHSVATPDALGKLSWDALPGLDASRTISIAGLSTGEIWVNLFCPETMKPGHYKIPVLIKALNGFNVQDGPRSPQDVEPPSSRVEIDLEVLNFKMAPQGSLRLCAWGSYDKATVKNLLEHGNNVFVLPQGKSVPGSNSFDYSEMDKVLDELSGYDAFILLSGLPAMIDGEILGKSELSAESVSGLYRYLDQLTLHLTSKGIDKRHFAFYPYDEPGGIGWTIVNKLVAFSKIVKQKDPELLFYMDGGGEDPMFRAMQPYIDIWCVGYNALPEISPAMDIVRKDTGSMLWSYDCSYSYARPMGPNIKNINIVGQFRISPLAAMRWNAIGIGYWSYNHGPDMWGRTMFEYPLVYKGTEKPVNSRRWEAVREGIEDYRIILKLKELQKQNPNQLLPEADKKINHLVQSMNELVDQSDREIKLGLSRKVIDATNSEESVKKLRKEIMDCIKSVTRENPR